MSHSAIWNSNQYTKRRILIDEIKTSRGCADCGYNKYPEALDFDHTGDKGFNVSNGIATMRLEVLMAEIEKCDVVCANCHRHRTKVRMNAII